MIGGIGTTEIILVFFVLILYIIPIAVFLIALYYIIKSAVKKGILEAQEEKKKIEDTNKKEDI